MTNVTRPHYRKIFKTRDESELANIIWAEVVAHLQSHNLLSKLRLSIADRYTRTRVQYEFISETALKDGPVKVGPNGGDVYNFKWTAMRNLGEDILKFEKSLLISPETAEGKISEKREEKAATAADEFLDK